jgi:hypothetical protein
MLVLLFVPRLGTPRAGRWSAVTGVVSSLTLFAAFQIAGTSTVEGSRVLAVAGWAFEREAGLLVVLPLALAAFAAGAYADHRRGAPR